MFPTILPWPMTLAPMNEAISCGNHAEKKKVIGGGNYQHDPQGHVRCKDSIIINKCKVLWEKEQIMYG